MEVDPKYDQEWPPDYMAIFKARAQKLKRINEDPEYVKALKVFYTDHPVEFINDWGTTSDPRNLNTDLPVLMPFIMFKRQEEMVMWIKEMLDNKENGAVDKSRDEGATWIGCAFSWWLYLFHPGSCIGWGSRKAELVDSKDDPKCIFDKIRTLLKYTPKQFKPPISKTVDNLNKLVNKEIGTSIVGECGDNIGRGGRTSIYFKDESAHYEHPEKIEAALGENTSCQIDISTHNGTNTIYYRAIRNYPKHRVFILDWSHDPRKSQAWFDARRKEYNLKGLEAQFAQEVERDPRGSVENVVIPSHWIRAAINAHLVLGLGESGQEDCAALDIADAGKDHNTVCHLKGWIIKDLKDWEYAHDTSHTLDKAIGHMVSWKTRKLKYDCIGIGAGVKGDVRKMHERGEANWLKAIPFNSAHSPVHKDRIYLDGLTNGQVFRNRKSQGWWALRTRFLHTYLAITDDQVFDTEEMISICSSIENIEDIIDELSQPTYCSSSGKIVIDKKPDFARSPNKGDSIMIAIAPEEVHKLKTQSTVTGFY